LSLHHHGRLARRRLRPHGAGNNVPGPVSYMRIVISTLDMRVLIFYHNNVISNHG
jgi:hypothetical protein